MSHEHNANQGSQEAKDRKHKNSSMAAFGFVIIVIILIVSAANYLRIQQFRFTSINQTEKVDLEETTPQAAQAPKAPSVQQPATTTPQQDTQAH